MLLNKYKIILLSLLLCVSTPSFATEMEESSETQTSSPAQIQNHFGYVSIGGGPVPFPFPKVGLGYRLQRGHHGMDLSSQTGVMVAGVSAVYLYYSDPHLKYQKYKGIGLAAGSSLWDGSFFYVAPKALFGKEYINRHGCTRFVQVELQWPSICFDRYGRTDTTMVALGMLIPQVVISYGIGF